MLMRLFLLVTGGGGGIGLALARGVLEHGGTGLALFDMPSTLDSAQTQTAIAQMSADFPAARIVTFAVNVTVDEEVQGAVAAAWTALSGIRHLICCAGIVGVVPSLQETADRWRRVVDVNLTGSFICAQAVAR